MLRGSLGLPSSNYNSPGFNAGYLPPIGWVPNFPNEGVCDDLAIYLEQVMSLRFSTNNGIFRGCICFGVLVVRLLLLPQIFLPRYSTCSTCYFIT